MAFEEMEPDNAIRTVIRTSRKNWKLHDVIPNANTSTPVDEDDVGVRNAPGTETI